MTWRDKDIRQQIALTKARAADEKEALSDPDKSKIYLKYMNEVKMAGFVGSDGAYVKA